jgi:hypothetical protein
MTCPAFAAEEGADSLVTATCRRCGHGAVVHTGLPWGEPSAPGCVTCDLDATVARLPGVASASTALDLYPPDSGG